ncbi:MULTISPECIES: hypothetical protein [Luteimonas]|uniref:hypothetical protein n=1 Tax=Luteimonas TaxID=83614 RepID=UPI000C7DAC5E|nr:MULTISPECIES: hypothetical protein [Luteimonas]
MHHIVRTCALALPGLLLLAASPAHAAGARIGVQANHGEMTLLRDVNARHAVRPVPPSTALIVDPTPTRQLQPLIGGELSDADFMSLDTGNRMTGADRPASGAIATTVTSTLGGVLHGGSTRDAGGGGVLGTGPGSALGGSMGAVTGATRGIGAHVTGALAQFPLGQPANGGGP